MDNDRNICHVDIFKSNHWKQKVKTISENASYAKTTSQECLLKGSIGNHDIKVINWKKVLSFLETMYAFSWPENDREICSLDGTPALNKWLFSNHVQERIFTPVLLDYLEKKRSIKSTSYFSLVKYALELIQFFKTRFDLDFRFIRDKELANKDALINFTKHSYPDIIQQKMIQEIARKLLSEELNLKENAHKRPTKEWTQDFKHPAVNAHISDLTRSGVKEKSICKYKISYALFLRWLHKNYVQFQSISPDGIPLSMVTEEHLLEFKQYLLRLASKGIYSKQTVSNCFYDIRFLLGNLYQLGWLSKDITLDITGISFERYYYRELPTDAELQKLFQNIQCYSDQPLMELAAFGLMLCLGLRIHEVAGIRYENINLENRTISVFGKNDKSAVLPLPDTLQKVFQKLSVNQSQDSFVFGNHPPKVIRELREHYKLYSFVSGWNYPGGPHLLRHVFISRLSEHEDCPPQLLMYLARHDRPENTARYIHRSSHQLLDAVNKINY